MKKNHISRLQIFLAEKKTKNSLQNILFHPKIQCVSIMQKQIWIINFFKEMQIINSKEMFQKRKHTVEQNKSIGSVYQCFTGRNECYMIDSYCQLFTSIIQKWKYRDYIKIIMFKIISNSKLSEYKKKKNSFILMGVLFINLSFYLQNKH